MASPKLSRLELHIMETLWARGECSIREIQEAFPETGRPGFTTVQTMVYRLEAKEALHCYAKRIGKANIFEAAIDSEEKARSDQDVKRTAQLVRQQTSDGSYGEVRSVDSGGCQGGRAGTPQAGKTGEIKMTPASLLALANHLWQSTLFVAVVAIANVDVDEPTVRLAAASVVGGSLREIPDSLFVTHGNRQSLSVAVEHGKCNTANLHRHGRDQPTFAATSQPVPGTHSDTNI